MVAGSLGGRQRMSPLRRKEAMYGYIAIAPWFVGFMVFTAGPMVYSAYLVFTEWELITPPRWVGLANIRFLMEDQTFRNALRNTVIYTVFSVPLQLLVALGVALLLNLNLRGSNWYRAVTFLPSQTPAVASAMLWFFIFSPTAGLANSFVRIFGISEQRWLWDVHLVKPALIVMAAWAFGGAMIIFLAGLQDIPQSLYEAADIDGASAFSKFANHLLQPRDRPDRRFPGLHSRLPDDRWRAGNVLHDARPADLPARLRAVQHGVRLAPGLGDVPDRDHLDDHPVHPGPALGVLRGRQGMTPGDLAQLVIAPRRPVEGEGT
jgi:multiple sugar transport system permease protein